MRQRILSGQWTPGQMISNLDELELEFGVARVTVRQAVDVLRDEGLLLARQGRGTFVSANMPDRYWLRLATSWESLISSVKDNVPRTIEVQDDAPAPMLQPGDGRAATDYVLLKSVQYRVDEPYSVVNLCIARDVYDKDPDGFLSGPALPLIASLTSVRIRDAHQTVVIGSADAEVADALVIPLGAPTVECRCVFVDDQDTAICVADIKYRSDCIKLRIEFLTGDTKKKPEGGAAEAAPRVSRPLRLTTRRQRGSKVSKTKL